MSLATELMAAGIAAGAASQIGSSVGTALVGAGTTKATGLQLKASLNVFATVTANSGTILPAAGASPVVTIYNGGAQTLKVYAKGNDVINASSAGAAFSVATTKTAIFIPGGTRWVGVLGA